LSYYKHQRIWWKKEKEEEENVFVTSFIYISEDISAHDLPYTFLKWKPVHVGKRRIQWQKGRYLSQRFLALSVGIIPLTLNFYISFISTASLANCCTPNKTFLLPLLL
jgi:hypothetical protein